MGYFYRDEMHEIPRFIIIGVGPHAKRTYVPHLRGFEKAGRAKLVAAIETEMMKKVVTDYSAYACPDAELCFVPPFTAKMPGYVERLLDAMVKRLRVTHVIIATEPRAHKAYGLWALGHGFDIIMDKPLTTRQDVVISKVQAYGIARDYTDLWAAYENLQRSKKTIFLVNCQRRYHPGFQFTLDMLKDIQEKTGSPLTNIISTHCDGQWRLPSEIVDIDYHGFNDGYGKVSHSGYHLLDTLHLFTEAGMNTRKRPDRIEVVSSFILPNGAFKQLTTDDLSRLFGDSYDAVNKYPDSYLRQIYQDFGEIDANVQITFFQGEDAICLAQVNLQHNGFSRRHWTNPNMDLYKGNGRVKHESHELKSGPFQTIVIDSRQVNDKHDKSAPSNTTLGSDNHFEVQVFRNCGMLGGGKPLEVFSVPDIDRYSNALRPGLLSENVKRGILEDALDYAEGKKSSKDLKSNLADHCIPVHIMSAIYVSHIQRTAHQSPIVTIDVSYGKDGYASARYRDTKVSQFVPSVTTMGESVIKKHGGTVIVSDLMMQD
ncbi:hypothetical protein N0V94_005619 [Neodidymelliopsis sp. IMI 364377]|nr:hypothetical protein N0V94_005619 [Neodidymelliopsis sp. IMI 364377]